MRQRALAVLAVFGVLGCGPQEASIEERLAMLPGSTVMAIEAEEPFAEAFDLRLEQPLDHQDSSAGSFSQRILVEHRGYDRPVVLVTEGYELARQMSWEVAAEDYVLPAIEAVCSKSRVAEVA